MVAKKYADLEENPNDTQSNRIDSMANERLEVNNTNNESRIVDSSRVRKSKAPDADSKVSMR
jgi:hypothetical protein